MLDEWATRPQAIVNLNIQDSVLVPCFNCGTTLDCYWEREEPQTRDHPGSPGYWYSINDVVIRQDFTTRWGKTYRVIECHHEGAFSREQTDEFQSKCSRIAEQSFEYTVNN